MIDIRWDKCDNGVTTAANNFDNPAMINDNVFYNGSNISKWDTLLLQSPHKSRNVLLELSYRKHTLKFEVQFDLKQKSCCPLLALNFRRQAPCQRYPKLSAPIETLMDHSAVNAVFQAGSCFF